MQRKCGGAGYLSTSRRCLAARLPCPSPSLFPHVAVSILCRLTTQRYRRAVLLHACLAYRQTWSQCTSPPRLICLHDCTETIHAEGSSSFAHSQSWRCIVGLEEVGQQLCKCTPAAASFRRSTQPRFVPAWLRDTVVIFQTCVAQHPLPTMLLPSLVAGDGVEGS